MELNNKIQVSEAVGPYHPDKLADVIADRLLSLVDNRDFSSARVAFEVAVSERFVCVMGEYSSDEPYTSKDFIKEIQTYLTRYNTAHLVSKFNINLVIKNQSKNINDVVNKDLIPDNGIVYGYADNSNEFMLPYSQYVSQLLNRAIYLMVSTMSDMYHDYKIMVETKNNKVLKIVVNIAHSKKFKLSRLRILIVDVVNDCLTTNKVNVDNFFKMEINPGGEFFVYGLEADSGVTNRKLMVDNYGANVEHGGGGYSGKDMSKPDRLFGYYARYIAKNVVAAGLSSWCKTRIIYSYGAHAIDRIDVTGDDIDTDKLNLINNVFPKKYKDIYLMMYKRGISYHDLAQFGHFGSNINNWEMLNMVDKLRPQKVKTLAIF